MRIGESASRSTCRGLQRIITGQHSRNGDHLRDADRARRTALSNQPAGEVDGYLPSGIESSLFQPFGGMPFGGQAQCFDRLDFGARERVVELGDLDVLRRIDDTGLRIGVPRRRRLGRKARWVEAVAEANVVRRTT